MNVAGGVYVIHNLTLSNSATINWTGPAQLYIVNSYSVTGNASINTYQNLPANRSLLPVGTETSRCRKAVRALQRAVSAYPEKKRWNRS